jgi:hypothetical protein
MSLRQLWNRLRLDLKDNFARSRRNRSRCSASGIRYRTSADFAPRSQPLEQRLMLTSDLTEVLNYNSLILTANDVVEIEIGGDTAGNPAGGNNIDGFDQINVSGSGTVQLAGLLDVKLVNNYVPDIGSKFQFLNISSPGEIEGRFSTAFGLFSCPANDRYFDVTAVSGGLCLEVKALPGGLHFAPPDSQRDAFGRFLSTYFDNTDPAFSCSGSVSVPGFFAISGTLAFAQSDDETLVVGTGINVTLDQETAGLEITDADFGLVITSDHTWAMEVTGSAALTGLPGFSLSGTLFAERSTMAADIQKTVTVNSQSVSIDVPAHARRFAGDNLELNIAGFANLEGDFAFDVSGTSVTAVATALTAQMQAGSFSAGLTNASLGLVLTDSDTMVLEVQGGFLLSGGDFASASAEQATLRYNTTNVQYTGETITIGPVSYEFTDIPAATDLMVLSAQGLSVDIGEFAHISGNAAFQRTGQNIEVVVSQFTAELQAGSGFSAGVSAGTGALLLNTDGTRQVWASGNFALAGAGLASVSGSATVAQNNASAAANQRTVTAAGITVVVPAMAANLQSVAATAEFTVQDFFRISGNIAIEKSTSELFVTGHDTPVSVEMLQLGGSDLNVFAGIRSGTANATGLAVTGAAFGVMLASPVNSQTGQDQRTWTAATGTAETAELLGIAEITAAGTSLAFSLNQAGGTLNGTTATAVADFSAHPLTIPTGGDSPVVLDHAGKLLQVSGTLSLTVSQFFHAEGAFAIRRSQSDLRIGSDSAATAVDLLTIGASDISAFVGINGGQDNPMGLAIGAVSLGVAVATSQTDAAFSGPHSRHPPVISPSQESTACPCRPAICPSTSVDRPVTVRLLTSKQLRFPFQSAPRLT